VLGQAHLGGVLRDQTLDVAPAAARAMAAGQDQGAVPGGA
jgi:hypothetical protein